MKVAVTGSSGLIGSELVRSLLFSWVDGERDVVFRLEVHELTGRLVGPL